MRQWPKTAPPLIAVTSGEPAGIGPEICLALTAADCGARVVILADKHLLVERARLLNLPIILRDYAPGQPMPPVEAGTLDVWHHPLIAPSSPGQLDPANSPYVLALLDSALAACQRGECAAMVTAPLHKGVINDAGIARCLRFTGHTEYLAEQTGVPKVVMMLAGETGQGGSLRVALATTHLPLRDVADAITPESLTQVIRILHRDLEA
ncbi:MAG: 4-hydroxythreonine-4-phosphate dehydrogenase PdxA, partial [Zoogloeaceae bacterium]|nr:4-hydroxythreonine-4-phosphate dehydrogenase PdxA [Zoogloeaceae bacterium]